MNGLLTSTPSSVDSCDWRSAGVLGAITLLWVLGGNFILLGMLATTAGSIFVCAKSQGCRATFVTKPRSDFFYDKNVLLMLQVPSSSNRVDRVSYFNATHRLHSAASTRDRSTKPKQEIRCDMRVISPAHHSLLLPSAIRLSSSLQ